MSTLAILRRVKAANLHVHFLFIAHCATYLPLNSGKMSFEVDNDVSRLCDFRYQAL